eukprot:TRINITY_DN315_c0_g1_i1.p1 TRINITY_DN315_c0_g1~~TRINITY_DN315_c0_g1_i1.p1  ORF type:complete len:482 (+),score=89.31 TRINITY_DN315_c0_g1_i1:49-1494(+)
MDVNTIMKSSLSLNTHIPITSSLSLSSSSVIRYNHIEVIPGALVTVKGLLTESPTSKIYLATFKDIQVVIKVPKVFKETSFKREAGVLNYVGPHENVVVCMGVVEWKEPPVRGIMMKYLPRGLKEYLLGGSAFSLYFKMRASADIAKALAWMSSKGVLHGKLTIDEILVDKEQFVVIDFGSAEKVKPDSLRKLNKDMKDFAYLLYQIFTQTLQQDRKFIESDTNNLSIPPTIQSLIRSLLLPDHNMDWIAILHHLEKAIPEVFFTKCGHNHHLHGLGNCSCFCLCSGFRFWNHNFKGKLRVGYEKFWERMKEEHPLIYNFKEVIYRLIADPCANYISVENIRNFIYWFGPLDEAHLNLELVSKPWFYGRISDSFASKVLLSSAGPSFMVRLNNGAKEPVCLYPYTLSINSSSYLSHIRIGIDISASEYVIRDPQGIKYKYPKSSLVQLIQTLLKEEDGFLSHCKPATTTLPLAFDYGPFFN